MDERQKILTVNGVSEDDFFLDHRCHWIKTYFSLIAQTTIKSIRVPVQREKQFRSNPSSIDRPATRVPPHWEFSYRMANIGVHQQWTRLLSASRDNTRNKCSLPIFQLKAKLGTVFNSPWLYSSLCWKFHIWLNERGIHGPVVKLTRTVVGYDVSRSCDLTRDLQIVNTSPFV